MRFWVRALRSSQESVGSKIVTKARAVAPPKASARPRLKQPFDQSLLLALLLGLAFSISAAQNAQGENIDGLLSIEDTGFDPSLAGGTIEYLALIDNEGVHKSSAPLDRAAKRGSKGVTSGGPTQLASAARQAERVDQTATTMISSFSSPDPTPVFDEPDADEDTSGDDSSGGDTEDTDPGAPDSSAVVDDGDDADDGDSGGEDTGGEDTGGDAAQDADATSDDADAASADSSSADSADDSSASVDASVVTSSIAGTVFRDFADDAIQNGTDSGIAGVEMTLTGTDVDGDTITPIVVNTDANGDYIFPSLAEGTYIVTRGVVNEPFLVEGQNSVGSEGGTLTSGSVISAISLPENTAAVDYDFAEIPQARIGLAKALASPATSNADGTFNATFELAVENFSLEPLINIAVTDPLAGANPLFGNLVSLSDPSNDPMLPGSYTITGPPSGTCGGLNASFNGDGDQTVASGFSLGIGANCSLAFSIRVSPEIPTPSSYENQATVTGEGQESGQTSNTNPLLTDLSDDGTNPDADGDDQPGEPGEDDATALSVSVAGPAIALIKSADTTGLSSPPVPGDLVRYTFEVRNTGDVTLSNVTIIDTLPGIQIVGSIASLAPGATDDTSITATYPITINDINTGTVTNTATVTGTDPFGTDVSDDSGTTFNDNNPTLAAVVQSPSIALIKTADTSGVSTPATVGDIITYNFQVTNTGNVTLTDVTLTDILPGIVIVGDPIPSLAPGAVDSATFVGVYAIEQSDIDAGEVTNLATIAGTPPSGPDVTDDSGTSNSDDSPTIVSITQVPSIELDKIADDSLLLSGAEPGDVLPFSFTVTNTGNVPLTNVTVTDALPGVRLSGGPIPLLNPGEVDTTTYTAEYDITSTDISAGEVVNDARVTGTPPTGPDVSDEDVETVIIGNIQAIPEVFPPFTTDGGTTTSMLASDLLNNQPATLATVEITVIGGDPGVTLDPNTALITLEQGFPAGEYQVEYQICSIAQPTLCDSTVETVTQAALPMIEATKTQVFTDDGDGQDDPGDVIDYTITVRNTGNVALDMVRLVDTITDLNGAPLTLTSEPVFRNASLNSPEGRLELGEFATYTAQFVIDLQAVNARGVSNQVEVFGTPDIPTGVPGDPTEVSDLSDDGDDFDGDTESDPTVLFLDPAVADDGITISKSTPNAIVERGAIVPYTITVTNNNAFTVGPADIIDTLPASFVYVPGSATLNGAPIAVSQVGRRISIQGIDIPAQGTVVATLQARVLNGARAGTHENTVSLFDTATGEILAGPATAIVRILPEAVFDCGDVIGKVFEDHNGNGYQDAPGGGGGAITDQTYHADKFGKYETYVAPPAVKIEKGIPGVRIVSPDGTIITTDANGLYSVPCAALPLDRGSNYILKVDERTLPAGFRPTTENPRVVRLTPGMLSEVNFGAAPGKVVNIALSKAAFVGAEPSPALTAGIKQLASQLNGEPVVIRLAWHVGYGASAAEVSEGRSLMARVEKAIRREWRWKSGAPVRIVTAIVRGGE